MLSALTSVVNFLIAIVAVFIYFLFGNLASGYPDFGNDEINYYVISFVESFASYFDENTIQSFIAIRPIFLLVTAIFALGAIIGLCRRLIRG